MCSDGQVFSVLSNVEDRQAALRRLLQVVDIYRSDSPRRSWSPAPSSGLRRRDDPIRARPGVWPLRPPRRQPNCRNEYPDIKVLMDVNDHERVAQVFAELSVWRH